MTNNYRLLLTVLLWMAIGVAVGASAFGISNIIKNKKEASKSPSIAEQIAQSNDGVLPHELQKISISGKVTDAKGHPVSGKLITQAVAVDVIDGNFKISDIDPNSYRVWFLDTATNKERQLTSMYIEALGAGDDYRLQLTD